MFPKDNNKSHIIDILPNKFSYIPFYRVLGATIYNWVFSDVINHSRKFNKEYDFKGMKQLGRKCFVTYWIVLEYMCVLCSHFAKAFRLFFEFFVSCVSYRECKTQPCITKNALSGTRHHGFTPSVS